MVSFDPITGTMTYTPDASEAESTVTIVYEVCNSTPNPDVCAIATVSIVVTADDGD